MSIHNNVSTLAQAMISREQLVSSVAVEGYKSIAHEQRVELSPLTVLAGANSSGKSSMMQPLLLLKQTLEAPFDPGALRLDGPNVRFTMAEQLLSKSLGKQHATKFSITLETQYGVTFRLVFVPLQGAGFDLSEMDYCLGKGKETVCITHAMSEDDILKILPPEILSSPDPDFKKGWKVLRDRCFFELRLFRPDKRQIRFFPFPVPPTHMIIPCIEGVIHVPGFRGNPERTYTKTASDGLTFAGNFEPYVASVIAQWQNAKDRERLRELGSILEDIGLTWKVEARAVDDTRVELRVARLLHGKTGGARDLVSIADVGFGVSQTLPVVVALLVARPGQIVYLEQPEIHLHPAAQRRLVNAMIKAAQRGVILVIETHSTFVLREIQTRIAQGHVSPDLVRMHWFTRDAKSGATEVTTAKLDNNGAFGDWPEDFDNVSLSSEQDYLDAVEHAQPHK
jgi:hypothetical protein